MKDFNELVNIKQNSVGDFDNLKKFDSFLTNENKKQIAREELSYLHKKLEKIDKEINKYLRKIKKNEEKIKSIESDYINGMIDETYYKLMIQNTLSEMNINYFEFNFYSKLRKELISYLGNREKRLMKIIESTN